MQEFGMDSHDIVLCRSRLMVLMWLTCSNHSPHTTAAHILSILSAMGLRWPQKLGFPRQYSAQVAYQNLDGVVFNAWATVKTSWWRWSISELVDVLVKQPSMVMMIHPKKSSVFVQLWKHQPVDNFLPCSEVGLFLFHLGGRFSQSEKGFSLWDGIAIPCHSRKIACFDPSTETFSKSKLKLWKSRAALRS